MSISMNNDLTNKLIDLLLEPEHKTKLEYIIKHGGVPKFGLLDFSIAFGQDVLMTKLPVVTVNLLSETTAKKVLVGGLVKKTVEQAFIKAATKAVPGFDPAQADPPTTAPDPDELAEYLPKKKTPDPKPAFMSQPPSAKEVKAAASVKNDIPVPKASGTVIPLSQATDVGQKVLGTSPGAVYQCVAVGPVNVAVKPGLNQVSIRVEGPNLNELASKLTNIGFTKGSTGKYWSMHLNLGDFDVLRAIGGVLFSMDLHFDKIASSKKEFV